MFRLVKLAAFSLFGYALYELIRGMMEAEGARGGRREAFGYDQPGRQSLSGPGEGEDVTTSDVDGGSIRHKVGRGVIS